MTDQRRTFCRNCPAACGLLVETDNGRVVAVRPDMEHPMSGGYMCVKGLMSAELHANDPDRVLRPFRRSRDGGPESLDLDQALDEIHARIGDLVRRHGRRSIAVYYGTGSKMNPLAALSMKAWLDIVGTPNLFSSSTVDQSARWVAMDRLGAFAAGKPSVHDLDVLMIVGQNPAVSHHGSPTIPSNNPRRHLAQAKDRGLKLILVDPRRTETARYADLHLQIKPGEDPSLFAGMINIVLENGWQDHAFCERFVTPLDTLRAAVRPFTPRVAAERAGVSVADMEAATELFATSRRHTVQTGTGPDMSARSNLSEHLIEALNAICGGYRRAGDTVRNPGTLAPMGPIREAVRPPTRAWEREPRMFNADAGLVYGEFPASRLPGEIDNDRDDRIRGLVILGGNPVKALGDGRQMQAAMRRLELSVCIDIRMTETGEEAEYFIPTKRPYEHDDFSFTTDPLPSEPFVQVTRAIVDAPGQVCDDWEIFAGLAHRMNAPLVVRPRGIIGGMPAAGPGYAIEPGARPTTGDIIAWFCESAGLSYAALLEAPTGMRPQGPARIVEPAAPDMTARLDVCPADIASELAKVEAEAGGSDHYALRLVSRRMIETMNSAFRDLPTTRRRYPVNPAFMNPDDMAALAIAADDQVEIQSEHGAVVAYARPDPNLRAGVVSMNALWGRVRASDDPEGELGAFTGRLVSLDRYLEPINYMPRQSGIPVNVVPRRAARRAEVTGKEPGA